MLKLQHFSGQKIKLFNLALYIVNLYPAKLFYLNFQSLEVVSRYRGTQRQAAENYSYVFNCSQIYAKTDV